tara:strand:+ start:9993 stop:10313 length:321 start_codon:yes stop_codon:yes gene_type:complete
MKISKVAVTASVLTAALLAGGCDIEQTEEAEMPDVDVSGDAGKLPDYEVIKTEEGRAPDVDVDVSGGNMPEYDVETPEVDVDTKTVEMEVPTVDVDLPEDDEQSDK